MPRKKSSHYDTTPTEKPKAEPLVSIPPEVKFVVGEWKKYDAYWQSRLSDFDHYYEVWKGKKPERPEEWQAQHNKKLVFQDERNLVSRFHSALFPTEAPIDHSATEDIDEVNAIIAKSMVAHYFKMGNDETVQTEFLKMQRSSGIYGTGYGETEWFQKRAWIFDKGEVEEDDYRSLRGPNGFLLDKDGNVQTQLLDVKKKVFREKKSYGVVDNRPRLKFTNIFAWRVHPKKMCPEDGYPAIKQEFVSYETLLDMQEEAKALGFEPFEAEGITRLKEMKVQVKESDYSRHLRGGDFKDQDNPEVELKHYWGLYALQDEKGTPKKVPTWITIANDAILLRKIRNPHWHQSPPLVKIVWTFDPKESWYGIGLPEIGEASEARVNDIINYRFDNLTKIINVGGSYNANDPKIEKRLLSVSSPGLWRPCSEPGKSYQYDRPPDVTTGAYVEEQRATEDHRDTTGSVASLAPTSDPKQEKKTLGQSQISLHGATERLKPDLKMQELQGVKVVANRFHMLLRQFGVKEELIELLASEDELKRFKLEKMMQIDPKRLIGKADFYCTGLSEFLEKEQMIEKLLKFREITQNDPTINIQEVNRRIANLMGFPDIEKLVNPLPLQPQTAGQTPPGAPPLPGQPFQPDLPAGLPSQIPQALEGGIPPEELLAQLMAQQGGA